MGEEDGAAERIRQSLPLRFSEDYDLPLIAADVCSQHQGLMLTIDGARF